MHILVFRDSITQGFHDDEKGGWVGRLFSHCVKGMLDTDYKKYVAVFNLGISGERSCDLINRFDSEFAARQDTEVITLFAIGTNDSARNIKTQENWCPIVEYKKSLNSMITKAKANGRVVLVGLTALDEGRLNPIPWFNNYSHFQEDRDKYDQALKELAKHHKCTYIELDDLFLIKKWNYCQMPYTPTPPDTSSYLSGLRVN